LPKCDATKKETISLELALRETIDVTKKWKLKLSLDHSTPKTHVLGQLSSLNISEPLIIKNPVMTVGSVNDTQRVGECASKAEYFKDVTELKFGKFRRFKVPSTWIPSDVDEDEDYYCDDDLSAPSQDGGAHY
jgi:hypothetical protein